ncbi:hypothetical protein JCM10213v2_004556 [Rhodosporidiobolus nylandii]
MPRRAQAPYLPALLEPPSPASSFSLHLDTPPGSRSSTAPLDRQLKELLTGSAPSNDRARTPEMAHPDSRSPLPTPPASPPVQRVPGAAGAASNSPMQPLNAHQALYGQLGASSPPLHPIPYAAPARGSTFFVSGSGTQRLGSGTARAGARQPLPTPPMTANAPSSSPAQASPTFDPQTSYAPPSSPGALPPGAQPLPLPGQPSVLRSPLSTSPPPATTKVPLATSSSILLHAGFYDLLAATGSRFRTLGGVGVANGPLATPSTAWSGGSGSGGVDPFARAAGAAAAVEKKKNRRISKDIIGAPRPSTFQHAVHASSAEQAEALLMRWNLDRQGKVGAPTWAQPIKEAISAAQRAAGVAEAQYAREQLLNDGSGLKVVNGLPDSVIHGSGELTPRPSPPLDVSVATAAAVEDDGAEDDEVLHTPPAPPFAELARVDSHDSVVLRSPLPSPPALTAAQMEAFAAGGTTRFSPGAFSRPGAPPSFDRPGALAQPSSPLASPALASPTSPQPDFALPPDFVPSLSTIERAASCKIFLEMRYHALLKSKKPREMRRALLEQELARLNISDRERMKVREAFALSETEYLREMRARVGVGSFVKLKTIGHGAFGVVSLVRQKGTGEVFAMKQLRKADMLKKAQEGHIRAERDLLAAAASSTRWTVPLAYSFQDQDHLYLCMSFMSGGDLLSLLIERDTFPEAMARFYLAEMVLAVEETHKVLGAIHRDIKPDNFLFDGNGHLAIADFGLACDFAWFHDGAYYEQHRRELLSKYGIDLEDGQKGTVRRNAGGAPFDPPKQDDGEAGPPSVLGWRDRSRRRLAYSLAVEVLRGTGYSAGADWWSIGIIAFEMLYGYPPFVSKSRPETKQKILNWRASLRFPSRPRISREAQDFIMSLICEPDQRLGSRTRAQAGGPRPNSVIVQRRSGFLNANAGVAGVADDGADDIKKHPFFRGIDWQNLHLQTPPFQPDLKDPTDTRYFDDDITPEPLPAPEIAPGVPAPDTTRDPLLRHPVEGQNLLALRKQQAFAGWTFKKPKRQVYDPRKGIIAGVFGEDGRQGRGTGRKEGPGSSLIRSLSV